MVRASTDNSSLYMPLEAEEIDQDPEAAESIPDLSCPESLSLSHYKELATEVHSKVSLLQKYSAPLEYHTFD